MLIPELNYMLINKLRLKDAHRFYVDRIRRAVKQSQLELNQVQQAITEA